MEFKIPKSLQAEHAELHEELAKAIAADGKVSEAAKTVAALLHTHFEKEEEYALPPLGVLSELAQRKSHAGNEKCDCHGRQVKSGPFSHVPGA